MKFAVFILTHARPNNQKTIKALLNSGYTGDYYLIVDDEDNEKEKYKEIYKEKVIIFNKQDWFDKTDSFDNLQKKNSVVYARNANFDIALKMGLDYFWQLDDDYTQFRYTFDEKNKYITSQSKIKSMDLILQSMIEYMDNTNISCLAFSQGGDFIGGEGSNVSKVTERGGMVRKVMNSFLFNTKKPIKFIGRMNDDVNTYVDLSVKGTLLYTVGKLRLEQAQTQSSEGGLTDMYLEMGTYKKSFYTVLCQPSCVLIKEMGVTNKRLHHSIKWNSTTPMLISDRHKK